jgi:hypothetical protein
MEWIWLVVLIAILIAPALWPARKRTPPRDSIVNEASATGLDQLPNNARFR